MSWIRCPTCHTAFDSRQSRALPFCSERCRLIDLGRWLNEENGLPVDDMDDDDEPPREGPWRLTPR